VEGSSRSTLNVEMPLAEDGSVRTINFEANPVKVYVVLLVVSVCYFGKYFCTSNMYVVQTIFQKSEGITDKQMSHLFALGFAASVLGKITAGILSDKIGGKPVLMVSAFGYIACTLAFSVVPSSYTNYLVIWFLNGFLALGLTWVAVVAVAANWIPKSHTGRLMSLVNLAPQIGDAMARAVLAPIVESTGNWRLVFQTAAAATAVMTVPAILFAPNEPHIESKRVSVTDILHHGAHEPGKDAPAVPKSFGKRLQGLLVKPLLYICALLSGSLYGIRVLFLLYSTTYLATTYCNSYETNMALSDCMESPITVGHVGTTSMVFTSLGCVSVLLVGKLMDVVPEEHRGGLIFAMLLPLIAALALMTKQGTDMSYSVSAVLVGVIGFTLFGPYKNLGTTFATRIGGKDLKATACAIMGISDNTFAVTMLMYKGTLGKDWVFPMFKALFVLSLVSTSCAFICWQVEIRAAKAKVAAAREPLMA